MQSQPFAYIIINAPGYSKLMSQRNLLVRRFTTYSVELRRHYLTTDIYVIGVRFCYRRGEKSILLHLIDPSFQP